MNPKDLTAVSKAISDLFYSKNEHIITVCSDYLRHWRDVVKQDDEVIVEKICSVCELENSCLTGEMITMFENVSVILPQDIFGVNVMFYIISRELEGTHSYHDLIRKLDPYSIFSHFILMDCSDANLKKEIDNATFFKNHYYKQKSGYVISNNNEKSEEENEDLEDEECETVKKARKSSKKMPYMEGDDRIKSMGQTLGKWFEQNKTGCSKKDQTLLNYIQTQCTIANCGDLSLSITNRRMPTDSRKLVNWKWVANNTLYPKHGETLDDDMYGCCQVGAARCDYDNTLSELIDAVHNGRVKHSTVEMTKKKKADLLEVLMDPGKNNKKEDGDDPTLFFSINDMDQLLEGDDIIDMEEECEGDEDDVNAKGYDDLYDKKQKELYKKIETGMITVVRLHEMCNDLGIGDYFELILSATEFPCVICDLSILYEFRACFFDLINMSRMAASKVNLNRIKKPGKLFSKAIKNKTNAGCKPLVKGQFLGEKTELEITKRLDEVELTPKQLVDYSIFKCLGGGEDMMKTMAQLDKNNKMEDYGYNFFAEEISPPVLLRCMEGEWLDKFPFMRSIIDRIKDVALSHALPRKRIFCYINPRIMACECNIYETVRSRCLLGVKISLVNTMLKVMKRSQTKTILNQVSSICKEHGIAYEICNIHINKTMKEDKKIIKERLARKRSHPN
ncbi:ORF6 [Ostreid herpesvirus 1]|nr:ORF6 [Ostreid herpesvirus 1]